MIVASGRLAVSLIAALGLFAAACEGTIVGTDGDRIGGSGDVITETRSVAEFERIVLAGEGRVLFAAGSDDLIEIETDDNLVTRIRTEVSGNTLTIATEPDVDIDPTDGVTYRLGCPEVTAVVLSGAGSIDLATCATTGRLEIELPGAGTIIAPDLDLSTVRAVLPGSGSIAVTGTADRLEVVLAGAGDFDGTELRATDAEVESLGVGVTSLWVTDNLDLQLTGVGTIRYYGEPAVSTTVTGIGTIESLGPK